MPIVHRREEAATASHVSHKSQHHQNHTMSPTSNDETHPGRGLSSNSADWRRGGSFSGQNYGRPDGGRFSPNNNHNNNSNSNSKSNSNSNFNQNRRGGGGSRFQRNHHRGGGSSAGWTGSSLGRGRGTQGGGRMNQRHHQRQYQRPPGRTANPSLQYDPSKFDPIEEIGPSVSSSDGRTVRIAVEGCCHGELDVIYQRLRQHEVQTGHNIDLLICCGDFQSFRNVADFHSSSIPPKYRALGTFPQYYAGEKVAPILTIFIGGNHEASQPLRELYYGGWVAPNIYYLGAAGVVQFAGLRIGGISGIYKRHDYPVGHYERPPYDMSSLKSVYHVRNVDIYRMKCLSPQQQTRPSMQSENTTTKQKSAVVSNSSNNNHNCRSPLDIMISHDWPLGIEQYGDIQQLLRQKPYFRKEIEDNDLGSPPNREVLDTVRPRHWFAAHLHVKFKATIQWTDFDTATHNTTNKTKETDEAQSSSISEAQPAITKSRQQLHSSLIPSQAVLMGKGMVMNEPVIDTTASSTKTTTVEGESVKKYVPAVEVEMEEPSTEVNIHLNDDDRHLDTATTSQRTVKTEFLGLESANNTQCNGMMDLTEQMTRFLALDKCLPRRQFLCIVNIPIPSSNAGKTKNESKTEDVNNQDNIVFDHEEKGHAKEEESRPRYQLEYDPEWLSILKRTHHLSNPTQTRVQIPSTLETTIDDTDLEWIVSRFTERSGHESPTVDSSGDSGSALRIPNNFSMTVPPYTDPAFRGGQSRPLPAMGNPQTDRLLEILQLDHIVTQPYDPELTPDRISAQLQGMPWLQHHQHSAAIPVVAEGRGAPATAVVDTNEIDIDGDDEDEDAHRESRNNDNNVDDDNEIDIDSDVHVEEDEDEDDDGNKEVEQKIGTTEYTSSIVGKTDQVLGFDDQAQFDANEIDIDLQDDQNADGDEENAGSDQNSASLNDNANVKKSVPKKPRLEG